MNRIRIATLVAFSALGALSAEAGQSDRKHKVSSFCNYHSDCIGLKEAASKPSKVPSSYVGTSKRNPRRVIDANGNTAMVTVGTAFGFNITVHPAYASKFQKLFVLLKDRGYRVPARITKCWAPRGTHVAGSNHYIGAACDIQTGWNRGPAFVYRMDDIVREAGLYSGCAFRDCGHVEAIRGTHNRAPNLYTAMEKYKSEQSTANYQP
jgi:hypothetical protein